MDDAGITIEELRLAGRNHSMPIEALRYDITPTGLHYLLTHFDIPQVQLERWRLRIGGLVRSPVELTLDDLRGRPAVNLVVTLECAGNGRAHLNPRPLSQPWLNEAVGTATWTGTPLRALLEEAGQTYGATEVVFTGLDSGVQDGIHQQYERSLPLEEASREEVLLAYEMNGEPLAPQHGFPLRLIVPGWYGMTQVKWLRAITLTDTAFDGFQQAVAYHVRGSADEVGVPVTRMMPRALLIPPGIPDFFTRLRHLRAGACVLEGRAWSGWGPVISVKVSTDGGATWKEAELGAPVSPHAWLRWTLPWDATVGEHLLLARAEDSAGHVQPLEPAWNVEGVANNGVQAVRVMVADTSAEVQLPMDRPT
jgi:DMSO/TMAO reductase YedYZ molybdopterin-dependent catalytic subunit